MFEPDWEQHFTPWTAPRLFKKGADFGGGAAAYHDALTQVWIPEIEQVLSLDVAWRGILGYSLAGLFALYNAYCAPYFDYVACVSGSLWFDGWLDFAQKNTPAKLPKAMYFSLGDTEANSKNPRMATVQAALEQTAAQWQSYACPSVLKINQGGHFDDVPQRLAKAAQWLMQAA
ncbi:alpha/beta hydrolase-fold protein [Kingella kingae]|uniref:alpha/beta hydrolase-fold protein n=1 Tax=Kingella kingae TaxID=504 RepID=UPI0025550B13|nr:alpha/beta hydrolase-fold protein [Kingella kingae]MDK4538762.1 alpha/beta hydrolase-fold protein [Kingella kingae]